MPSELYLVVSGIVRIGVVDDENSLCSGLLDDDVLVNDDATTVLRWNYFDDFEGQVRFVIDKNDGF